MSRAKTYTLQEIVAQLVDTDPEAARAVLRQFGPPPPIYSEIDLRRALQVEESDGARPEDRTERSVGRVLAMYVEDPRVNAKYVSWLRGTIEDVAQNGVIALPLGDQQPSEPRRRAPITDPAVRQMRNEALAKARAVRQQRLAAQKERAAEEAALANAAPEAEDAHDTQRVLAEAQV